MANNNGGAGSVPRTGLKNTVRFAWKEDEGRMPRDTFARTVLMGALKLRVQEVMCLQGNAMEEAYDVTFHTEVMCDSTMDRAKAVAGERPLSFFNVTCLAKTNFRVINVHMYNPHVSDIAIREYLSRFCEVTSGARYVKDSLGFWNGRRQFQVLLRPDQGGFDGFLHPPASFSLGSDRGMLFYTRQPPYCKKCREYGHVTAACSAQKCRFCQSVDHEGKNCTAPKECHGCGSRQHLYRECPGRKGSYAAAAAGGRMTGGRGMEEKGRAECGLSHSQEDEARGEKDEPPLSLPATQVGGHADVEERALAVLGVETQMAECKSPQSLLPVEVEGAMGEMGPSLDAVFIDEMAFGALVGEMREMVEELQVSQTRPEEWRSVSPLPVTPRQKRVAPAAQRTLEGTEVLSDSGEARKKKKKIPIELGEGQSGLGGEGEIDSAAEVVPPSSTGSSFPLVQMEVDLETSVLVRPAGDGVSQASSGTPGPPIPNHFPASWVSQEGSGVGGVTSESVGQEPSYVGIQVFGGSISDAKVDPMSSQDSALPFHTMEGIQASPGLFLPSGDGVSQAISGTPGLPNPFPASWISQDGNTGRGRVEGASDAAGVGSLSEEEPFTQDRVSP